MAKWTLHLHSERSPVPETIRMRQVLKRLLRAYSFRCEAIECDKLPPESNAKARKEGGMTQNPSKRVKRTSGQANGHSDEIEVF